MDSLVPRMVKLVTIVTKIEDLGIHVIDASVSHFTSSSLGVRVAVRGSNAALVAITDFVADSVVDPIRFTGEIARPLLVTNVLIDGLTVHISASGKA
jgi:hypothetical protein